MKHDVIRTPIDTLNILGAGGIKRGSMVQMYGPSKSGKSTFCYQTCSFDMMDNEDCVLDIIDVENSTDLIRLIEGFQLDMDRVNIHHFPSLEEAFKLIIYSCDNITHQKLKYIPLKGNSKIKLASKDKLLKMDDKEFFSYCLQFQVPLPPTLDNDVISKPTEIKPEDYDNDRARMIKALARAGGYYVSKKIPYTDREGEDRVKTVYDVIKRNIIWDTIAVSRPQAEFDKIAEGNMDKNAAGQNVHAQVVSKSLSACLSSMGGKPVTIFLPNQVREKANSMGGYNTGSSGSHALEHNCHYILKFSKKNTSETRKENFDEDAKGKTGSVFVMEIEKAKFCPATKSVELYINDKLGGIIIPKKELFLVGREVGVVEKAGAGWFTIKGYEESLGKLRENKNSTCGDSYIVGNPSIRKILNEEIARHYRGCYNTLNILYERCGKGEFGRPLPPVDGDALISEEDEMTMNSLSSSII